MSSIGSDIESGNNTIAATSAPPIDPAEGQIDHARSSVPNGNDRPSLQHIAIRITVDGNNLSVAPLDITNPDLFRELVGQVEAASRVVVDSWDEIANLPLEARQAFVTLATINGPIITVRVGDITYLDAFAATLALTVNAADLREVERYLDFAVAVAAASHPGASSEAARRVRDRLRALDVQSDDVRVLARRIRDHVVQPVTTGEITPQDAADFVLAQLQEERRLRAEENSTTPPVRFWNGELFMWTGKFWQAAKYFEQIALRILQVRNNQPLTNSFVQSTNGNIHAKVLLDCGAIPPPFIVETESPLVVRPRHVLAMSNGTIDLDEVCCTGQLPTLQRHDPRLFCTSALPYDYDPQAGCPLWLTTLSEIFTQMTGDDHRHELLQEFAGYLLMVGDHRFETFLILVGHGANGKSTILNTLAHMLGVENVSNIGLECFGKDAHLYEMANKLANIATEMHRMDKVEEGILKSWVSGEPRQVDRKFRRAVTIHPTAKLIFATNHLPALADTTAGIWRRVIVLPLQQQFSGDQCDRLRKDRLLEELPGVLNWALSGALRLLAQGGFTRCSVCDAARTDYQHDSDPFRQFIDERGELGRDFTVLSDAAYSAYHEFCDRNGRRPKGNTEFGRQVARLNGVTRQRETSGERRYYYLGLSVRGTAALGSHPLPLQRDQAAHPRGVWVGAGNPSQVSQ